VDRDVRERRLVRCDARLYVVRGFQTGCRGARRPRRHRWIKVDADVSVDPDYFERLVAAFDADRARIASGSCYEQTQGEWRSAT